MRVAIVCTIALFCAACAATPEATSERDAEAKRFRPDERSAVVYVYREDFPSPWSGDATLWANDRLLGQSLPGTFFRVTVLPGRMRLAASPPDQAAIEIETRAAHVTFVALRSSGGFEGQAGSRMRRVPPEQGEAAIRACCTLLETWRPDQPRLHW